MALDFGPATDEIVTTPQQIAGSAHGLWIDVRQWEIAAADQLGNFFGIDPVVFRFSAVNSFHIQCMAEDKRYALVGTKVGQPVQSDKMPATHVFCR